MECSCFSTVVDVVLGKSGSAGTNSNISFQVSCTISCTIDNINIAIFWKIEFLVQWVTIVSNICSNCNIIVTNLCGISITIVTYCKFNNIIVFDVYSIAISCTIDNKSVLVFVKLELKVIKLYL